MSLVRKDLIESGKVKSMKDFKGLKVAVSAAGNSESFLVDYALRKGGMTIADVEPVYLGFPQHVAAYANGGIDASLTVEPTLSTIVKAGTAVRFAGIDQIYPNFQTAVIFYSEKFAKEQPEQAKKFMRALIHAARDYNDALDHGHLNVEDTCRGPVKFDQYGNVVGNVYIRKVEKKSGKLVNAVIKTYPNVSQFWTYKPEEFLKSPVYNRETYPENKNLEP